MKEKIKNLYANKWFQLGAVSACSFLSAGFPELGLFLWFVWFIGWVIIFE